MLKDLLAFLFLFFSGGFVAACGWGYPGMIGLILGAAYPASKRSVPVGVLFLLAPPLGFMLAPYVGLT